MITQESLVFIQVVIAIFGIAGVFWINKSKTDAHSTQLAEQKTRLDKAVSLLEFESFKANHDRVCTTNRHSLEKELETHTGDLKSGMDCLNRIKTEVNEIKMDCAALKADLRNLFDRFKVLEKNFDKMPESVQASIKVAFKEVMQEIR